MEHGKVTTVNYKNGAVHCNVRAIRLNNEYEDVPVMKPHSGFIQVPKQNETVAMQKLSDGTRFISDVISRESDTPDNLKEGELSIQLDNGTRVYFEELQSGSYNLNLDASGEVLVNGNTVGGGVSDHTNLTGVVSDNHHTRYTDSEAQSAISPHKNTTTAHGTAVPLSITHGNWAAGLSNEEIHRLNVPTGSVLEVHALDLELKGGGSLATPSNLTVDVYDATSATVLASTDADATATTGSPIGSSGDGNTIIVRISNSSGSEQGASITGSLYFV